MVDLKSIGAAGWGQRQGSWTGIAYLRIMVRFLFNTHTLFETNTPT